VMAASFVDPEVRCAMNIRFTEAVVDRLRATGAMVGTFDRGEEPAMVSSMEWGTAEAIRGCGHVPDVIYDRGGAGKEAMVRVLGRDPDDVLRKVSALMR